MICDKCHEAVGTGYKVTRKDGEVWCYECAKKERAKPKNPKRVRSKDKFVLLARRIHDVHHREENLWTTVILSSGSKRCYTNGHVILSNLTKTPAKYRLVSVDNLWKIEGTYPDISREIPRCTRTVEIPEDFYNYLRAFSKPKPTKGKVNVILSQDGIDVLDSRDDSSLRYQEGVESMQEVFEEDEAMHLDLAYVMSLKPRTLYFTKDTTKAVRITRSYDKTVDYLSMALMMPMKA